jgi:mRNA interferase HigB
LLFNFHFFLKNLLPFNYYYTSTRYFFFIIYLPNLGHVDNYWKKYLLINFPFWELNIIFGNLRVIAKKMFREFWDLHKDTEQQLQFWHQEASASSWRNPNEIKRDFPSASILGGNRVVFNIKGNAYRLIVKINYHYQMI